MKTIFGRVEDFNSKDTLIYPESYAPLAILSGYILTFKINNIQFYSIFTGIFFNEGDEVYVVYDEKKQDELNVFAVLNKKNHLLGIIIAFKDDIHAMHHAFEENIMLKRFFVLLFIITFLQLAVSFFIIDTIEEFLKIYFTLILPVNTLFIGFILYVANKDKQKYLSYYVPIFRELDLLDLDALKQLTILNCYVDIKTRITHDDIYYYPSFLKHDPKPKLQ